MAEKEQTDVEMKDVSDEPKSDAEGGKEKVQEKAKDVNMLTIEDVREQLKLIEKGVSQKESRFINRALRKLLSIRKRLNDTVLRRLLMVTFPSGSAMREDLLPYLPEPMDTEDVSQLRPKSSRAPPLSPESECFVHLLVLLFLIDGGELEQAQACADVLMEKVAQLNSRTLDLISARCFFYYARVYELRGELAGIRSVLHARLRTATLRHDEEGQAVLLNLLLRNYLHYNLFDQADKLIAKSKFPETASNNEGARYLYYTGRIKAIQLEYSEAYTRLLQAIRKAPQDSAVGFLQTAHKFAVVVQLLLGEIPERALFREPMLKRPLEPYFQLAQAVHSGDVARFSDVLRASQAKFQQDKTYTLIIRLRHNVIKTGIRMISLSYSRISLADIAEKLSLESTQDAEYIVAKAIKDGVIEAVINHEEGYVQSRETADIYSTKEPQDAFHQRIQFCLELHNQSVKAMRYPPKVSKADEEESKERLEREKQDIELASEIEDEDEEDGDYLP